MKEREKGENIKIPESLKSRLELLIDNLEQEEISFRKKNKTMWMKLGGIAASLYIICAIGFSVFFPVSDINEQLMTDEELYQEAYKALELVATKYNKGLSRFELINNELEKTNRILNKTLKN